MSRRKGIIALMTAAALTLGCNGKKKDQVPTEEETASAAPVLVKVIAFNDLHGHIEGPSGGVRVGGEKVEAGGVDAMAAHLRKLRESHPYTSFVCAGDLVGASPLISALFHDEPTVEAMNAMGLDVLAVGNHEFDEGVDELLRLKNGGCHPEDGCKGKDSYAGANFPFLAANVIVKESGETLFPPYVIKEYGPVKVGYIGLTLEGTPDAVSPDAIKPVRFLDEAEVINKYAAELQGQGVEAIVVVIHEGGYPEAKLNDINQCPGLSGPIVEINANLSPAVDAIVAGHTHQAFNCEVDGRLITSAKSYGRILTEIDLEIDPKSGDVVKRSATNLAVTRDVDLDPDMVQHVARYRELVGPLASKQVGTLTADILRAPDANGYSALGGMIADAQHAATASAARGNAQFALMNLGGVRNDLVFAQKGDEGDGVLTFEELHSVQPFGNTLVVLGLTGAQIEQLLEQQWQEGSTRMLQPSRNFSYSWSETDGDHVALEDITLDGEPLDPERTYRVTVNSFLASGGDGFSILTEGELVSGGPVDLDVFVTYVENNSPLSADGKPRVTKK